jgi:hypothetical protein
VFKPLLTPVALFTVVLLSGCSGSGASAQCKEAKNAYAEYKAEADERQKNDDELVSITRQSAVEALVNCQNDSSYRSKNDIRSTNDCVDHAGEFLMKGSYYKPVEIYRLANKVIENNPQCFTPQQVAEAQEQLETSLQWTITTR